MAEFSIKNHGIGLLNTDWGDYYHLCQPEHSFIGLIYGAQFSWGESMEVERLNEAVSKMEFGEGLGNLTDILWKINDNSLYSWMDLCVLKENHHEEPLTTEIFNREFKDRGKLLRLNEANENLLCIKRSLSRAMKAAKPEKRKLLATYIVTVDGCRYFNILGDIISRRQSFGEIVDTEEALTLAKNLEEWFWYYKRIWRTISKESELEENLRG